MNAVKEENVGRAPMGAEQETLIVNNMKLAILVARQYLYTGAGMEDLVSVATLGLVKAIRSFDAGKAVKLTTYASCCMNNEIRMYLRKYSKSYQEVPLEEGIIRDETGSGKRAVHVLCTEEDAVYREIHKRQEKEALQVALGKLTEKEQMLIRMRYGIDENRSRVYTQQEAAELLGCSQSYVSRMEKQILKRLRAELQKEE